MNTPLHLIMEIFGKEKSVYKAIAENLIICNAMPNIKNKENFAPIHLAAKKH
jgi:hypothetical protein